MPPRINDAQISRLGKKLRALRKARHWKLGEVASAIGYGSHTFLSEIETGSSPTPPVDIVVKLARLYEVSLDALLRDEVELPGEVMSPSH